MRRLPVLLLALAFCAPAAFAGPSEDALKALNAGDYATALKLSRPLAQKDDGPGMYVLGKLYEEGKGVARDDYSAVKWLAAASHKANYAPAEYALARMYIDGRGVRKNPEKAKEWLEAAAKQGHAESARLLAELGGKPVSQAANTPAAAPPAPATPPPPPAAAPVAKAEPAKAPEAAPAPPSPPPPAAAPPVAAIAPPVAPPAAASSAPTASSPVLAAYQKGDYTLAYKLARPLALKDDGPGMYVLGKLYEEGKGVAHDDYSAVKWLAAASHKANYAPAEYALARMYIDGRGVGKNPAKAKEWLKAAAAQGHDEAQRLLAQMEGRSVPVAAAPPAPAPAAAPAAPATVPAVVAPAPAAKAPEPAPAPAEAPKTAMLARPAPPAETPVAPPPVAAPAAGPAAATSLAGPPFSTYSPAATKATLTGLETAFKRTAKEDPKEARAQLEAPLLAASMRFWEAEAMGQRKGMDDVRAAIQANAPAAIGVARGLRTSTGASQLAASALLTELTQGGNGVDAQACDSYIAAANARGPDHPPALYHAALCGAQKNPKQALDWLHAAAFAGHAGALEALGRACMEGKEKDWGCAMHYFQEAAGRGRPSSMTLYGWVLSNQPGAIAKDFTDALGWYRKGAAAGDLFAQNNIGEMYERGRGTPKDDKQAREWYGRAAEAGFGPGQFNYARMLLSGSGGPADRDGAVQWLQKADKNGVAPAKAALQQIAAAGK